MSGMHVISVIMSVCHCVQERWIAPIDPGAVLELERSAKHVATDLVNVMDNLRNSLHAVRELITAQSCNAYVTRSSNLNSYCAD